MGFFNKLFSFFKKKEDVSQSVLSEKSGDKYFREHFDFNDNSLRKDAPVIEDSGDGLPEDWFDVAENEPVKVKKAVTETKLDADYVGEKPVKKSVKEMAGEFLGGGGSLGSEIPDAVVASRAARVGKEKIVSKKVISSARVINSAQGEQDWFNEGGDDVGENWSAPEGKMELPKTETKKEQSFSIKEVTEDPHYAGYYERTARRKMDPNKSESKILKLRESAPVVADETDDYYGEISVEPDVNEEEKPRAPEAGAEVRKAA